VPHEGIFGLPPWLVLGLLLGAAGSLGVAGVFLVAVRLSPTDRSGRRRRSGNVRRRAEFREYLQRIGEPVAEGHVVAGQPVAFYLPKREVAITFDARAFYRIKHTDTEPVLVEHEVPGPMLGERLPFETPGVEPGADGTRPDPIRAAFDELGLGAGADVPAVKRAYRDRVKEVHPDQGGDEDEFQRVREAYTTAKKHAR
jgi:hypothetical protein